MKGNEQDVYCMKCKKTVKADLKMEEKVTSRGVKHLFKGVCPKCGTKVCKIGKREGSV